MPTTETTFNKPPVISDENPVDGSEFVSINLENLSFNLSDPEGNLMNYTVETTPDIGNGNGDNVSDDRYNISVTGLAFETTYNWYVNVSDGFHSTNKTYSFTTAPDAPVVSNEIPVNGAVDISLNPSLQADLIDYQDEDINWWILSNASGTWIFLENEHTLRYNL